MKYKLKGCNPYSPEYVPQVDPEASSEQVPRSGNGRKKQAGSSISSTVLALGAVALTLGACGAVNNTQMIYGDHPALVSSELPPMDVVLVSDLVRYYLDGDMEVDRGIATCYRGVCTVSDGDRLLNMVPDDFIFAGFHEGISAAVETIVDHHGISIGDVSADKKELPDIPGVAIERTITGYGGWGKYVGFDSLYYDYIRHDRQQRMVFATLGGYRSTGNPGGPNYTWKGGAVGIDQSDITEHRLLTGNSEVKLYYSQPRDALIISVDITDMSDIETGKEYDDLGWRNVELQDGQFRAVTIHGQFFGPGHEEVGGVFEQNRIIGAFGASRENVQSD